ncbi:delta-type opioid receptor-like [Acanthaster planci]|uniref:Delta-type opioid receptor-like n=1 Tax=Acanthaster planci TaxID=133434 RepID=A0A8B7XJL4_ACAPL|nr:delta-type opioid receptor-like [Acanthaster planci]
MEAVFTTNLPVSPPVEFSWTWQNICKLILGLLGICGNSLVIAAYCGKKKQKNSTNVLILALACADLISSVNFIPLPVLRRVPMNIWGELYCRLIFSQPLLWISIEASVYTLTLLSVERYLAVVHPIRYRNLFTKSWPKRFVWIIWIFAVGVKSFNFYNTEIKEGTGCDYISFPKGFNLLVAVGVALVEYFVPIVVMITCNGLTVKALRSQASNLQGHRGGSNAPESGPALSVLKTRRRIIHIVLIVIITFIICWTPDQISLLLMNLDVLSFDHFDSNAHQAFIILAFFNSCVNPIIYTFKNKQFRTSVVRLFCRQYGAVSDSSMVTDLGPTAVAGGSNPLNTVSKRTTVTTVKTMDKGGAMSIGVHSINSAEEAY